MVEKETKEVKTIYELVEVPTETALVVRDNSTGKVMNQMETLVLILNEIVTLKKGLL